MPSQYPSLDYPLDFKEACFYAWYHAGRPDTKILDRMPTAPDGRKPSAASVRDWMKGGDGWMDWHQHADILDAQMSLQRDKEAIKRRSVVLKQLAEDGKSLKDKGLQAILDNPEPFKDNPSAAVRAIKDGSEMQFKYSGMSESLANIASMDDKALMREAARLLGKNENDNSVIDVESTDSTDSEPPSEDGDSNPQDDLD